MARRSGISGRLNRILYVVAGCFIVCIASAFISITLLSNAISNFVECEYQIATSGGQIIRGNQGMGRNMSQMILAAMAEDDKAIGTYNTDSLEYRSYMEDGLRSLSELESVAVNHEGVNKALEMCEELPVVHEQIYDLCLQHEGDKAWDLYQKDYLPIVTDIRDTINSIIAVSNENAQARIAEKNVLVMVAYFVTLASGIVAIVVIYILIKKNTADIVAPISQLEKASANLNKGILDTSASYDGNDELGALCTNFNTSCEQLSSYVAEIAKFADAMKRGKLTYKSQVTFVGDFEPIGRSLDDLSVILSEDFAKIGASAEQVYTGAEQMSSVSTQLSRSAVAQADSVQELVTTINMVSDHVSTNATTANEARDSAIALYNSMTSYSESMKDVNKSITETRDMTAKVRGIVRNIEMISFQTNTLALNAAVEAARAGDAGRGFAVIANEIRELAGESNRAASDTSFLMNDVISKISVSAEQSQRAIVSLGQILADGNTTAASVEKISDATNNQTSALEQVRQSIRELSQSIQGITSMAEESAASAEELQSQMRLLNQMVDTFEIRKDI